MSSLFSVWNLSPLYTVTSRNVSSFLLTLCVNLMVGCIWVYFFHEILKFFECSCPYYEDVIYKTFPDLYVFTILFDKFCFECSHK